MLLNCGVGENSWKSLGMQEDSTCQNQSLIFIGRTDVEAETPILWPPYVKNWLLRKDPYAGKDWRQEKGVTKEEMVAWHHWLDGHEFQQALGVDDGQGSLECCSLWGLKESDMIERLNWELVTSLRGQQHSGVGLFLILQASVHTLEADTLSHVLTA